MLRRIGDQGVNLVLVFAARRTSEDFNHFAALAEHDPSIARGRWKSRSAKVQSGAAHRAKAFWFQQSIGRCSPSEPKDGLPTIGTLGKFNPYSFADSGSLPPKQRWFGSARSPVGRWVRLSQSLGLDGDLGKTLVRAEPVSCYAINQLR